MDCGFIIKFILKFHLSLPISRLQHGQLTLYSFSAIIAVLILQSFRGFVAEGTGSKTMAVVALGLLAAFLAHWGIGGEVAKLRRTLQGDFPLYPYGYQWFIECFEAHAHLIRDVIPLSHSCYW